MKRNNEKIKAKGKKTIVLYIEEDPFEQINHCKNKKMIRIGLGFKKM